MEIRFEAGSFQQGDKFVINPTRRESQNLDLNITRAEQVALASPISTDTAIGNRGNATIDQGEVYDLTTSYFSEEGEMTPPLLIRFTSPTTYDVLDNTDPGNPIPLFPPLMNQTYVPGISNSILPEDEGKTAFTSYGGVLPLSATYQKKGTTVEPVNGFFPERIEIGFTNPENGLSVNQKTLVTPLNASAREIAEALSKRDGIEASARTTIQLSDFETDANPFLDTEITLNGVALTDVLGPNQNKYESSYPEEVPDPITPNFLADRINANYELQDMGIVARSDGGRLTIIDLNGDDIELELSGDHGDSFSVSNGEDIAVRETGEATLVELNEFEGYNFDEGGPYTYAFDVPGQGTINFEMKGSFATGDDLLQGFRDAIENSGYVHSGNIDVDINEKGEVTFQPRLTISGAGTAGTNKIAIGGQVKVIADEHYSISISPPGNNLFDVEPVGEPVAFGFHVNISGVAEYGDEFTVDFNTDGTSDSRNGVEMAALQSEKTVNGQSSYSDSYARMVEVVGSVTSRAQINRDSSEVLLRNSQSAVDSTSGVNLDEEAAALIKYELAYNASAQVIQVARDIFDTLIGTFR
jgi:flagellar hook-associated protein 1 FlgK